MLYPRRGDTWPGTVESLRMVDGHGGVQYADSLSLSLSRTGEIESENDITVERIQWSDGPGLRLEWEGSPSDPSDPGTCRYFARRGARLVAVTPWCSACRGPEAGDVVVSKTWEDWFSVEVPARVRLDRPEGGLELVPETDPAHDHLAVLRIFDVDTLPHQFYGEYGRPLEGADDQLRVRLFQAPTGAASASVTITPSSRVRLGRLYAGVGLVPWEGGAQGQSIQVTIVRLEVTIDGRHGYVEEGDFFAVGLQQAG